MGKEEKSSTDAPKTDATAELKVTVAKHIVDDLHTMESNTGKPVAELVSIALKMFIATHNDYLKRNRVP